MESLALAAAVVVMSVIFFGAISALVAWRNPQRGWSRTLGVVVSIPAIGLGGWLALIDIGIGGRAIGAVVLSSGIAALLRSALKG